MRTRVLLVLFIAVTWSWVSLAQKAPVPDDPPGTFSILGFDPETGEVGAAVQSRVFSVGNGVLWAEAGIGAVATQAVVDVGYGPKGMALLKEGMAPKAIIQKVLGRPLSRRYSLMIRTRIRNAGQSLDVSLRS
jgi:hypothetical protein